MQRLILATAASAVPMGAQAYQEAIASRAPAALHRLSAGAEVKRVIARSLRSPLPGTTRLPMGFLAKASPRTRRLIGSALYGPHALVHRMDLSLPPGLGPDVVTLHDVVAWKYPDESPAVAAAKGELRSADTVICVSEFTAMEAREYLSLTNVTVVHNGVDDRYFDPSPLPVSWLADRGVPTPFVLYAGGSAARKNLPGLAAAWARVEKALPDWHLVLAGPPSNNRSALFAHCSRVKHLGRVDDALMPSLVGAAACVVVPSHCEGFGLPALEGMAAGVPVVSSNRSSLPEVVGDAGILVEPTPEALGEGLLAVASESLDLVAMTERGRQRARHFTWERSADGHAAVWTSLL